MTTLFFGPRWDAPRVDDAEQVPTPIGQPCYVCSRSVADGERGLVQGMTRMAADGKAFGTVVYVHTECEMLGVMGHLYGVCSCSGFDTSSRGAALELLARINAERAARGVRPL